MSTAGLKRELALLRSSLAALTPAQSAALDDPIAWAERISELTLDPWQRDVLLSAAPRLLLNATRQSGKSTVAALKAAWTVLQGGLAVVDSPLEATRCAIVIQQTIAARNAAVPKNLWLQYRIGINLGDVLVEADDIYGDGVNIAARLQTAATPGEVNISGGVYEQVKNKLVCGYQSLGDEKLKNITDPVRIYRVLPDPAAVVRARPVRRALRVGVPASAALLLAFAGGIWVSQRMTLDRPAPSAALSVSDAKVASGPDALPGLPPTPAVPAQLPASSGLISEPQAAPAPSAPRSRCFRRRLRPSRHLRRSRSAIVQRCPEMVRLPGGAFAMGSNDDPPRSRSTRSPYRPSLSVGIR